LKLFLPAPHFGFIVRFVTSKDCMALLYPLVAASVVCYVCCGVLRVWAVPRPLHCQDTTGFQGAS
jgi:hypothetical protein